MSWLCPYCSTYNEDESTPTCFVCKKDRPISDSKGSGGLSIDRSGFKAFCLSIWKLARQKTPEYVKAVADFVDRRTPEPIKKTFRRLGDRVKNLSVSGKGKKAESSESPKWGRRFENAWKDVKAFAKSQRDRRGSISDAPWPEHRVKFNDDAIQTKGYVKVKRATLNGVNVYKLFKADGSSQIIPRDTLIALNMASKK